MVWFRLNEDENSELSSGQSLAHNCANTFLDCYSNLDIRSIPRFGHLCGIICTIGPSCQSVSELEKMIEAGMNIARLRIDNISGKDLVKSVQNIRTAAQTYGRKIGTTVPIAIAFDTKGPEINVGTTEHEKFSKILLQKGQEVKVTSNPQFKNKVSNKVIYIGYDDLHKSVEEGMQICLSHGSIILVCRKVKDTMLKCVVKVGGILESNSPVCLPGVKINLPNLTEHDKEALILGVEQGIDMVFITFVQNAATVQETRNIIGAETNIAVVSKIENQQGIQNLTEIIKVSDGVMVERGNLGTAVSLEKLFLLQKLIISQCNAAGKPVICSNQMLFSMLKKPTATIAEYSDIGNIVLDGADCVMLSAETAFGKFPVECVKVMSTACKEAESIFRHKKYFNDILNNLHPPLELTHTIAIAAVQASIEALASAIIALTTTGKTAQLMAKYKPRCPIVAVTRSVQVAKRSHLYGGVLPLFYHKDVEEHWMTDVDARIDFAVTFAKWKKIIKPGDSVVLVYSSTRGAEHSDIMRVTEVKGFTLERELCGCRDLLSKRTDTE